MLNLSGIKNIIFDFGGVVINIDFNLTHLAFKNLGIQDLDTKFSQAKQTSFFDEFEKGIISPVQFRTEAKKMLSLDISDDLFDKAWNAMILNIPVNRIKLLSEIKQEYDTYLLSNSNKIHYDLYLKDLQKKYSFSDFNDLFKKAYFSFQIGMIKPHSKIFQYVLNENHLINEETLFIDDSIQHIEAADKLGIKTYFLNNEDIIDLFT